MSGDQTLPYLSVQFLFSAYLLTYSLCLLIILITCYYLVVLTFVYSVCRCGCECHSIYVWRSEDNLELILSCLVPRIKLLSSGIEGGAFAHQVISLAYSLCLKFHILCHDRNLCQRMSTKESHHGGFLSLKGNLFDFSSFLLCRFPLLKIPSHLATFYLSHHLSF